MRIKKQLVRSFLFFSLCAVSFLLWHSSFVIAKEPAASSQDPKDIYTQTALVSIAGRNFKIPEAYIDSAVMNGRVRDSIVLEFVWPDFKSKKEFPRGEVRMKEIRAGNVSSLLLEDISQKPRLGDIVKLRKETKQIVDFDQNIYSLDKYTAPKPTGKYAQKPDDTFLELSSKGDVVSYLRCSPPGTDVVPLCRHTFDDNGLRYNVLFSFSELPLWKEKRQKTINFINNFEIVSSQKE